MTPQNLPGPGLVEKADRKMEAARREMSKADQQIAEFVNYATEDHFAFHVRESFRPFYTAELLGD